MVGAGGLKMTIVVNELYIGMLSWSSEKDIICTFTETYTLHTTPGLPKVSQA